MLYTTHAACYILLVARLCYTYYNKLSMQRHLRRMNACCF